jgi:hypothetical protein
MLSLLNGFLSLKQILLNVNIWSSPSLHVNGYFKVGSLPDDILCTLKEHHEIGDLASHLELIIYRY